MNGWCRAQKSLMWSDEVPLNGQLDFSALHLMVALVVLSCRVTASQCPSYLTCCWRWGSSTEKSCSRSGTSHSGTDGREMTKPLLFLWQGVAGSVWLCAMFYAVMLFSSSLGHFRLHVELTFPFCCHKVIRVHQDARPPHVHYLHAHTRTHPCWFVGNFLVLVLKFYNQPERGSLLKQTSGTFSTLQNG